MSTHATDPQTQTPSVVAEHDNMRREQAETAGQPLDRSSHSAVPAALATADGPGPTPVAVWAAGTSVWAAARGERPERLTLERLAQYMPAAETEDQAGRDATLLALDSRSTLERLLAGAERAKRSEDGARQSLGFSLARQLTMIASLGWSQWVVIVPEALARRFWMPASGDLDLLSDWADVLDDGAMADLEPRAMVLAGLERAASGVVIVPAAAKRAREAEASALISCTFSGESSAHSAFAAQSSQEASTEAMTLNDPALTSRHVLTGDTVHASVLDTTGNEFEAIVSQPFRARIGARLRIVGSPSVSDVLAFDLRAVRVEGPELVATFEAAGKSEPKILAAMAPVRAALTSRAALDLFEVPFHLPRKGPGTRRWLGADPVEPVRGRFQMPPEVAAAAGRH